MECRRRHPQSIAATGGEKRACLASPQAKAVVTNTTVIDPWRDSSTAARVRRGVGGVLPWNRRSREYAHAPNGYRWWNQGRVQRRHGALERDFDCSDSSGRPEARIAASAERCYIDSRFTVHRGNARSGDRLAITGGEPVAWNRALSDARSCFAVPFGICDESSRAERDRLRAGLNARATRPWLPKRLSAVPEALSDAASLAACPGRDRGVAPAPRFAATPL